MLYPTIIAFVLGWAYFFYKYRDVFAPWSITLMVWALIMLLYETIDHGLYCVKPQFVQGIWIWCASLCLSSYTAFRLTPAYGGVEWAANRRTMNVFAVMGIVLMPFLAYKTVAFALANGVTDSLMENLRLQAVGADNSSFEYGPAIHFQFVAYALLYATVNTKGKIDKRLFALSLFLGLCFAVLMMGKTIIFLLVFPVLYLLYENGKISLRPILVFGLAFVFLGLLFTLVRSGSDDSLNFMDLFGMYLVSPIVAFSYETPSTSYFWGEETFRVFHGLSHTLGLTPFSAQKSIQQFTFIPLPTNVYTVMAPYFRDFGYPGIGILGALQGAVFGYVYKKGETGFTLARLFYAYFVAMLVLQFFDEQFFMSLPNTVQVVFLLWLFHVKFVWKKEKPDGADTQGGGCKAKRQAKRITTGDLPGTRREGGKAS